MRGYIDIAQWMLLDERIDLIDFNNSAMREMRGFDDVAIINFLIEAINRDV